MRFAASMFTPKIMISDNVLTYVACARKQSRSSLAQSTIDWPSMEPPGNSFHREHLGTAAGRRG